MPSKRLEYLEPQPLERVALEELLERGAAPGTIERALVAVALNEPDLNWAYLLMLRASRVKDESVRGTALLCFGHLARVHKRLPDQQVVSIVRAGLTDSDEYVRGQAFTAAGDLERFIPALKGQILSR
jgi:hypothetical protein